LRLRTHACQPMPSLMHTTLNFDANAARTGARTCLSLGIALAAALYLNWPVVPAVVTTQMLQSALLGIAVRNSISRFFAAIIAGFISLLILGLFPQDRFMIILCFAVTISIVAYLFQGSNNPYLWLITSALIAVIGLETAGNPLNTWSQAVHISSSFGLGGVVVIVVNSLIWPNPVRRSFEETLAGTLQIFSKHFELRRAALFNGDTTHAADLKTMQGQALKSAAMMPSLLDYTAVESLQISRFHTNYKDLINDIVVVGAELISLEDMLAVCLESQTLRQKLIESKAIEPSMDQLAQELDALAQQAHAGRDGSFAIEMSPMPQGNEGMDLTALSHSDRALFEALHAKAKQVRSSLRALREGLANVENPKAPAVEPLEPPKQEPFSFATFFSSYRFKWAVVVGVASFCGTYLWVLTQWPNGFRISLFVPVLGCLLANSWPGQRLAMITGTFLAVALGWVFYLLIMPTLPDDFWFLWLTMSLFLFPLVYLQALKNPFWALVGFVGGMAFCMPTNITHIQQYNFSAYMGVLIGMVGGILFALAFYSLFTWSRTEKDFRLSLEAFFELCRSTLLDFENIEKMPDAQGRLRTRRKALVGAYQKCVALSNRLPYANVPQNDKEKVDALLGSVWSVAARLDSMLRERARLVAAGTLGADQGAAVRSVMADAMDALQRASKQGDTVAQWPLAPAQHPEYDQVLQALSSTAEQGPASTATIAARLASAGFHRALSESIKAAYERFNLLDWRAWETERF
jgi:uncharacterized membrane protein YccC